MRKTAVALTLLALASSTFARADDPAFDAETVTGMPPAMGSDEARADLAIVLWEQRTRTPSGVRRAASEVRLDLADFANVLGPGFDPLHYPLTEGLLARAGAASREIARALKRRFARRRPFEVDARVMPAIEREGGYSFPSGHAVRGVLYAAILSELAPGRREALRERGMQIGYDRVLGGLHFPTDVEAGQRLGAAFARAWLRDPVSQTALQEARAREWAGMAAHRPAP